MHEGMSGGSSAARWSPFAPLANWIGRNEDLLRGLAALRALGPEAESAFEAVLDVPTIRRARLSWQLASSLTGDPEGRGAVADGIRRDLARTTADLFRDVERNCPTPA